MRNRRLPVCPYCKNKLTYFESWFLKDKGEYFCRECGHFSDVIFRENLMIYFFYSMTLAICIMIASMFLEGFLWSLAFILTILIFLAFYYIAPFSMVLTPVNQPRRSDYNAHQKQSDPKKQKVDYNLLKKEIKKRKNFRVNINEDIAKTTLFDINDKNK